jgi:hypothetical protein
LALTNWRADGTATALHFATARAREIGFGLSIAGRVPRSARLEELTNFQPHFARRCLICLGADIASAFGSMRRRFGETDF